MLQKIKSAYLLWYGCYQKIPRVSRHTLGERIDLLLIETIEAITCATFLPKTEKAPFVRHAIRKLDTAKVLLMVLWDCGSLETKKYAALSEPLEDTGRMLGGWYGQLQRQNNTPR